MCLSCSVQRSRIACAVSSHGVGFPCEVNPWQLLSRVVAFPMRSLRRISRRSLVCALLVSVSVVLGPLQRVALALALALTSRHPALSLLAVPPPVLSLGTCRRSLALTLV
jgi:hypothetical protein